MGLARPSGISAAHGDISHLSKQEQFDSVDQILKSAIAKDVFFVPGEHDVLDDNGNRVRALPAIRLCFVLAPLGSVRSCSGSEVSALLGRTASAVGYQPTLAAEDVGALQERITPRKRAPSLPSRQCTFRQTT